MKKCMQRAAACIISRWLCSANYNIRNSNLIIFSSTLSSFCLSSEISSAFLWEALSFFPSSSSHFRHLSGEDFLIIITIIFYHPLLQPALVLHESPHPTLSLSLSFSRNKILANSSSSLKTHLSCLFFHSLHVRLGQQVKILHKRDVTWHKEEEAKSRTRISLWWTRW